MTPAGVVFHRRPATDRAPCSYVSADARFTIKGFKTTARRGGGPDVHRGWSLFDAVTRVDRAFAAQAEAKRSATRIVASEATAMSCRHWVIGWISHAAPFVGPPAEVRLVLDADCPTGEKAIVVPGRPYAKTFYIGLVNDPATTMPAYLAHLGLPTNLERYGS